MDERWFVKCIYSVSVIRNQNLFYLEYNEFLKYVKCLSVWLTESVFLPFDGRSRSYGSIVEYHSVGWSADFDLYKNAALTLSLA